MAGSEELIARLREDASRHDVAATGAEHVPARETVYVVPREATLFWLDTWILIAGAPHPNAGYAWLNFIQESEVQGNETNCTSYATPNDRALAFVDPELLADPAVFLPEETLAKLEGAADTSANTQRIDIGDEFASKVGRG